MSDIQNQSERLKQLLRKVEYTEKLNFEQLQQSNPTSFLRIMHFILIDYSNEFYKSIIQNGYELYSKNDLRFVEQVYKYLNKELNYKPSINICQFLSEQYLEHKIIMIADLISEVLKRAPKKKKIEKAPEPEIKIEKEKSIKQAKPIKKEKSFEIFVEKENHPCNQLSNQTYTEEDEELQPIQRPQPYQLQRNKQQSPESPLQQIQQKSAIGSEDVKQKVQQKDEDKINQPNDVMSQQPVTQQDLQKLMAVIMMSNENIKMVMNKFAELQFTVNSALQNFNSRLTALEEKM
ncbi:hypothetical protein pb186bvf_016838 [Paramecium bursaria]